MNLESLSTTQLQRVDALCEPFEEAWRAGLRPRLEDVLAGVEDPERSALLGLLLAQEWEVRLGLRESPTIQEYRERFPGQDELIFDVVAALIVARDASERATGDSTPWGSCHADRASPGRNTMGTPSSTGRFRILNRHAEGGLGEISIAHDEELDRDVALKQIRPERSDDRDSRSRFVREAMVTGHLEHPGIVPVYGLGRDAGGRPFYAMRYVKGDTLAEVIRRFHEDAKAVGGPDWRGVEFRKLLGRFLDVCNVVDYAHSRKVRHRDLKPSNIMVGPFGETLVLDWGLAKELNRPVAEGDTEPSLALASPEPQSTGTISGTAVGTPRFMSPEQASGRLDRVGPASDVYSLGATLYCLLTGQPPFPDDDLELTLDKVRRGEFPLPRAIERTIPRPLEAICLKAMAMEPAGRYGSPRALGDDLERWLAGEPVSAWREPWTTKVRRAVARHRTMVTTGVALILLAFAGLIVIALLQEQSKRHLADVNRDLQEANRSTERARSRAEDRLAVALRAIEHFHRSVSLNLDVKNRPELKSLRRDLLQAPLEFYGQLKQDLQNNPEGRPEVAGKYAETVVGLAQITALIGSEPDAIAAYQQAIEVLEQLVRQQPAVDTYRYTLAGAYANLSRLQRTTTQNADALANGERARSLYRALSAEHPSDERYQFGLAEVENVLAVPLREERRPDEAMTYHEQARDRLQVLVRDHPKTTEYQSQLALVLSNLGVLQRTAGRTLDAKQSYEQFIATFQGLVRDHPEIVNHRNGLAKVTFNLGNLYAIDLNRGKEAMANLEQARDIQQVLVQENPTIGEYRADLAKTYGQIGALQRYRAPAESLANFERARDRLQELVRDHPQVTRYRADLALTHFQIGDRQISFKRFAEALVSLELARVLSEPLVREAPNSYLFKRQLGVILNGCGGALAALGRHQEAAAAYQQAIPQARRAYDQAPANPQVRRELMEDCALNYEELATMHRALNQPAEALQSLRAACDILEELPDQQPNQIEKLLRLYCQVIAVLGQGRPNLNADEQIKRQAYAGRAIALLRKRIVTGNASLKELREDRDLDPLRGHDDFRLLVMDLAFPPNPFAP